MTLDHDAKEPRVSDMIQLWMAWCRRILPSTIASSACFMFLALNGAGTSALVTALAAGITLVAWIDHGLVAAGRMDRHAALVAGWRVRPWFQVVPVLDLAFGMLAWAVVARVHSAVFVPDGLTRAYGPEAAGFWLNFATVFVAFIVNLGFVALLGGIVEARRRAKPGASRRAA